MKKTLVSLTVLSLMVGTQVKAADASKAMPAIISYLLSGGDDDRFARQAINSTDGIVEDKQTGLFWQDEEYTQGEDYAYRSGYGDEEGKVLRWSNAKAYCENLTFGGHNDWRLPNSAELHSIVDTSYSPTTINPIFNTIYLGYFWTAKKVSDTEARSISFEDGTYLSESLEVANYTRCVRGEKKYERVSINSTDGIVKDKVTNLWWQDEKYTNQENSYYGHALNPMEAHGKIGTQGGIANYCLHLNYANYSDWRLPTIEELESIVDTKFSYPTINPIFQHKQSRFYWSNTKDSTRNNAWVVDFSNGMSNLYELVRYKAFIGRCTRDGD